MAQFSYVQSTSAISTNTIKFTSSNTAGDIIVAALAGFNVALATGVTDSLSNSYTKLFDLNGNGVTILTPHVQVWLATSIAAGTNTITFGGMGTSDNDIIVAEYVAGSSYSVIVSPVEPGNPSSNKFIPASFPTLNVGTPNFANEVMLIVVGYDYSEFATSWTISNGTVRQQTHEADNAGFALGDYDVVSPTGLVTANLSHNQSAQDDIVGCSVQLITLASSGGGGGTHLFRVDMNGNIFG